MQPAASRRRGDAGGRRQAERECAPAAHREKGEGLRLQRVAL